jgi:hypothetical protein
MRDCAFYYDSPSIHDEREMRFSLQRKYDDLLPETWRPRLTSRKDLLTWACMEKNSIFQENGGPQTMLDDCENYGALLRKFGPDYQALRNKMGYVKGVFD